MGEQLHDRRVLIIDRDATAVGSLQNRLVSAGFVVSVHCGAQAFEAVDRDRPDLIVLNWNLPGLATRELLQRVRGVDPAQRPNLLAVSNSGGEQQVLAGFELGVDDFVVQPYTEPEIVARVRAILRYRLESPTSADSLQYHALRLSQDHSLITVGGHSVQLRGQEFRLLRFLLQFPDRAFTREQLLTRIWGDGVYLSRRVVDVTVQRARKALAPHACSAYLQSVRGIGYRLSKPPA